MEEPSTSELLIEKSEENQTRKILDILKGSSDLDEAIGKVEDLLKK